MADAPASLRSQQLALARHLRDPREASPPGGIDDRRLAIYRDLLHNNIRSLLAGNFPVIRQTLGEDRWLALVRDFFAGHRSRTPLFTEIGREFIAHLEHRAIAGRGDPPWLVELAHYEHVELALQISDAQPATLITPGGDLLAGMPVVSPLAWPLAYEWPVHRIGPSFQPDARPEAPTLLLVRRDASGDVRFALLSPLAYRLLELLAAKQHPDGRAVLLALAGEAGVADVDAFLVEGEALLVRMRDEGTLLGTCAPG